MILLQVLFWIALAVTMYAYVLYPLGIGLAARLHPRPVRPTQEPPRSISIVLAARNEAASVARRLREFIDCIATHKLDGEIIVVSDGSTDNTADIARSFADRGVRVIELGGNFGKAAAISRGFVVARGEIVVLADLRQTWDPEALANLLRNFSDPEVGAVTGQLVLESAPGVLAGVGLYWRYEKWLRQQEARFHSVVGATGAIAAVRRGLLKPIPAGIILDDVYWPLQVVMAGGRVVYDESARAFDRLPEHAGDEFRRKVRTLCGNFQLLARLPSAAMPWRDPLWLQYLSHKIARLVVPWALLAMLITSAAIPQPFFRVMLAAQIVFYVAALVGLLGRPQGHSKFVSAAASFVVLNAAAWIAFWVWITGRADRAWRKVSYDLPPLGYSGGQ